MTQPIDMTKLGAPLPISMGRCADLYHDLRELRLSMEKEVDALKERESEVKEHIIRNLSSSEDTGAAGLRFRAQVVKKPKPRLLSETGWGVFTSWVRKNDRFDMLQKRLSDVAVMDFVEAEKRAVPGTEVILVPDLSVTKL
jgi:hypothetical protein